MVTKLVNGRRVELSDEEINSLQEQQSKDLATKEANAWLEGRINEYPSIQDQLDMQYWDNVNNTTIWKDTIEAIKAKYPKQI